MVILCRVFLYFNPVHHEIEYDANYWLLSQARNHILANWFYEHHLCALNCVKLPISELLLPWDVWVSPQPHVQGNPKTGEMRGTGKSQSWAGLADF